MSRTWYLPGDVKELYGLQWSCGVDVMFRVLWQTVEMPRSVIGGDGSFPFELLVLMPAAPIIPLLSSDKDGNACKLLFGGDQNCKFWSQHSSVLLTAALYLLSQKQSVEIAYWLWRKFRKTLRYAAQKGIQMANFISFYWRGNWEIETLFCALLNYDLWITPRILVPSRYILRCISYILWARKSKWPK